MIRSQIPMISFKIGRISHQDSRPTLRLRRLRLQQEGGEIRRVQRHVDRAEHLAAIGGDDIASGAQAERSFETI